MNSIRNRWKWHASDWAAVHWFPNRRKSSTSGNDKLQGFFNKGVEKKGPDTGGYSLELLHAQGCAICPLARQKGLRHPHMPASGNSHPDVLCLGEGPGETEDLKGVQFVGKSGRFLRSRIPAKWEPRLRWNNCVRTRPPGNREPTHLELECCRPSIVKDIEETQPTAIFGFGGVPSMAGISRYPESLKSARPENSGIKFLAPMSCWFFPMLHPSGILRLDYPKNEEAKFVFERDLKLAFDAADDHCRNRSSTLTTRNRISNSVTGEKTRTI